jgi:hypothetical protein
VALKALRGGDLLFERRRHTVRIGPSLHPMYEGPEVEAAVRAGWFQLGAILAGGWQVAELVDGQVVGPLNEGSDVVQRLLDRRPAAQSIEKVHEGQRGVTRKPEWPSMVVELA